MPTLIFGAEGDVKHTRLRVRGWGSPNSDEGTCTVVLYMYLYFQASFPSRQASTPQRQETGGGGTGTG